MLMAIYNHILNNHYIMLVHILCLKKKKEKRIRIKIKIRKKKKKEKKNVIFFLFKYFILLNIFILGEEDDDNNNISGKSILGTSHNNISNIDLSSIPNLDSNIHVSFSSDTKEWSPNNLTSKKKKKKKEIRPKDIMSNSDSSNTSSINKQNNNQIKSVLLKENKGVKITGPCNVNLSIFLVPHIYIDVETKYNNIELKYELDEFSDSIKFKDTTTELRTSDDTLMNTNFNVGVSRDTLDKDRLYNICAENKNIYIYSHTCIHIFILSHFRNM
ncbi:hypothetical protein PFFVO_00210 [Plasmodium falciparum Vietnam Oak-Knoll (FVO)]|uniref:Uncharacterized protein n=1 Tax=Plasmodium falciparum Vietnam Oak-Knoll (FVO) TaxID=1036723 RepID=A0A024VCX6_PLAFA|nr:hypothetical protein PFFVO_00210 [Plasmodium falciparum Vietnam Oak-Knoll (FVO)]